MMMFTQRKNIFINNCFTKHLTNQSTFITTSIRRTASTTSFTGLPFTHTIEESEQVFKQWLKKSKLSPTYAQKAVGSRIEKYFVPFWIFSSELTVICYGRVGQLEVRRTGKQTYTSVRWQKVPAIQFTEE